MPVKKNFVFLAIVLFLFATQMSAQEFSSAERVLQKVADKLAETKLIGYKYGFEFSYPSQDRLVEQWAQAFLDLQPTDGSQFRFQFSGADLVSVYNGTERFFLDKKGKKIHVENKPSFKSFGDIFLQNSPLSLKYALPRITADRSIRKKVSIVRSGDREQYLIEFSLPNKMVINPAGEIVQIKVDQINTYRLKIDKATWFPVEVVQTNDKNDEILKTTYAEVTEKPAIPTALSWYFSSYQNEYALQKIDKVTLIEAGKTAPHFTLDGFESASKISLDQYKGKLVLLEFWIAHCGFCIAAVPKLNDISRRFRSKGLEMVSINMYDPDATIRFFDKKNMPEFTILTGGDSIATAYGVEEYPSLVLIDRSGKVVYSSRGLHLLELEADIVTNIKK